MLKPFWRYLYLVSNKCHEGFYPTDFITQELLLKTPRLERFQFGVLQQFYFLPLILVSNLQNDYFRITMLFHQINYILLYLSLFISWQQTVLKAAGVLFVEVLAALLAS